MKYYSLFLSLLAAGAFTACNGKDNPQPQPEPDPDPVVLPVQIFSQTFHSGLGNFTVDNKSKGGMSKNVWIFNSEHPEYGAVASGYDNNNRYTTEGWLVSPEIEIAKGYQSVYLRFDQALAYAYGEEVTQFIGVKVSENGGSTWVDKSIPNLPSPNSRFEKIGSGDIVLTPYAGKKIKIALVYKSNDKAQPTWEVMDLEISSEAKPIEKSDHGDEYKSVPAWMELPQVNTGQAFYIHTAPYETVNVRNYSFVYNDSQLVAEWVAYPLCDMYTKKRVERTDAWAADPFVNKQAIFYKAGDIYNDGNGGAKYNRGHQLPSADRLGSTEMNKQTFYYTNIAAQLADKAFNAGIWGDLESAVREWSASSNSTDTLYVVTGCVVKNPPLEVRKDNDGKAVSVPNAFYKALLRLSKGSYIGAAFYLEHKDYSGQPATYKEFSCSIKELEEKTGVNFFVNLPAETAATVKAEDPKNNAFWNLK